MKNAPGSCNKLREHFFVSFSDLKVMFKRVSCDHIKDNFQGGTTHDYHFRDRS